MFLLNGQGDLTAFFNSFYFNRIVVSTTDNKPYYIIAENSTYDAGGIDFKIVHSDGSDITSSTYNYFEGVIFEIDFKL